MTVFEIAFIAGMVAVTFGVRYPVLALVGKVSLPKPVEQALKFVPAAVLTAIIAPAMLIPDGHAWDVSLSNPYLASGLLAGIVAWRTKNVLLTIVVGMLVFQAWRLLWG